jgi:hypothetical protein
MYLLTFSLVALSYLTMFLVLPIVILGPLAMFFGWRAYRNTMRRRPGLDARSKLWAARGSLLAAASMLFQLYIINTQYHV